MLLTVIRRTTVLPTAAPAAFAVSAVAAATPLVAATTPPAIVLACGEGGGQLYNSGFSEKKFALQIHVDFFTFSHEERVARSTGIGLMRTSCLMEE